MVVGEGLNGDQSLPLLARVKYVDLKYLFTFDICQALFWSLDTLAHKKAYTIVKGSVVIINLVLI